MKATVSFEEFNARLDLEPIVFTLTEREDGPGWSIEKTRLMAKWYRRFLYLARLYPEQGVAPMKDLDLFWHTHILETQKYMDDWNRLFGRYFHHFLYFGVRGEEDRKNSENAFEETEALYLKHFSESPRSLEIADCGALCNEPVPKYNTNQLNPETRPVLGDTVH